MALSKIQAESMNLADTFAFTGTVSGAGDLEKVSSSTATQTGLTNLQITLPTTDDFTALKLFVRGLKSTTATNSFWGLTLGDASGTAITSSGSYYYIANYTYSNLASTHGVAYNVANSGDVFGRMSAHYVGDGSSDFEMMDFELTIFLSNDASRSTRVKFHTGYEKRHTDSYVTFNDGSIIRNGAEVNANINLFVNTGSQFTSYGYGLYKVKS